MITQPEKGNIGVCLEFHAATKSELTFFFLWEHVCTHTKEEKKLTQLTPRVKQNNAV